MAYGGNPTGSLKDLLIASTVGGFGISMGRDAYKKISRNLGLVIAAVVLAGGTAYGVWNLVRGHARASMLRTAGCVLLAAASIACTWFILAGYVFAGSPNGGWTATLMTICLQGAIATFAGIVGWVQRGKRVKGFAMAILPSPTILSWYVPGTNPISAYAPPS